MSHFEDSGEYIVRMHSLDPFRKEKLASEWLEFTTKTLRVYFNETDYVDFTLIASQTLAATYDPKDLEILRRHNVSFYRA